MPASLWQRTNLKTLMLDRNNLSDLPPEWKALQRLSTLTLSRNDFERVPDCVWAMHFLKILHLHQNRIPEIAAQIVQLAKLQDLNYYSANLLTEIPAFIRKLKHLQKFDVSKNEIPVLCPEVGALT